MVTTSYPRFPGDLTGTFLEPIAHSVAERGHAVHIVAPWHPLVQRPDHEGAVHFHFYRYAPFKPLNVFGYGNALKADTSMRATAYAVTPFALIAASRTTRRVVRTYSATVVHAHWVIPSGVIATLGARSLPIVVSLHGSDVYVAEKHALALTAARYTLKRANWITACSDDLYKRAVAIGADKARSEVIPYGVDADRFAPNDNVRSRLRHSHGMHNSDQIVLAVGRLVRKKGFEYLIDAVSCLTARHQSLRLVIAGSGDLDSELRRRAANANIADRVMWLGAISQTEVAHWLAAADVVALPSIRDDSGNVDGLPNAILEALASATPVVTTTAGGIGSVATDRKTALVVPERDADRMATAIDELLTNHALSSEIGQTARKHVLEHHSWARVAEQFESAYAHAVQSKQPLTT